MPVKTYEKDGGIFFEVDSSTVEENQQSMKENYYNYSKANKKINALY